MGPPALKLQGTADCTAPDPASSGKAYYYRYVDYQLVDLNNNRLPTTQHYTVYEQLSPYKDFASCKDKGKSTGRSPCGPANGDTVPYNVFNDNLSLQLQSVAPAGIHNTQSFFYQLPGQRPWPVLEIDRWGGRQNSWTEAVAGSSLDLWLRNQEEPLIDGHGYPYMAPAYSAAGGTAVNCKGQPPPQ